MALVPVDPSPERGERHAAQLPELDHNEVVGWSDGVGERFHVVALRSEGEHPDVAARFEPSLAIARGVDPTPIEAIARLKRATASA